MTDRQICGRVANERGYFERDCPFDDGPERVRWLQEWNDAEIDREIWESANWHLAHTFGEAA